MSAGPAGPERAPDAPAFESLVLRWGTHQGGWTFRATGRPLVVLGPNGSGKSTLLEGLLRTLYGFDRRTARDAAALEARAPWTGGAAAGQLVVVRGEERLQLRRDFGTGRVEVLDRESGEIRFAGDGNPAGRNPEAIRFREILAGLLGLTSLDAYAETLFIRQGDPPEEPLTGRLLAVGAGGHARVETALQELAARHRALTRRALVHGQRPASRPRALETAHQQIESLEDRLAQARAAAARRSPALRERDHAEARLHDVDDRIRRLEAALPVLAAVGTARLARTTAEADIRRIRDARAALDRTDVALRQASSAMGPDRGHGPFPPDLPERIARARLRQEDRHAARGPAPGVLAACLAVLTGGLALLPAGRTAAAALAAALGLIGAGAWAAVALIRGRRRRRADSAFREALGSTLPDLDPYSDLAPYLAEFHRQVEAERTLRAARAERAHAIRNARRTLRGMGIALAGRGIDVALDLAESEARDRAFEARTAAEAGAGGLPQRVPPDVEPTSASVAAALESSRAIRDELRAALAAAEQTLLEHGTPRESPAALDAELRAARQERDRLDRRAAALEAAHALVSDAHAAFRDRDQDRLVRGISRHVQRLSGGRLGPLAGAERLEDARIRIGKRAVDLRTPPLSFGEYHILQIAVRLGAADFLAGLRIAPPLLIDDPFAHLDQRAACDAWAALVAVARSRQVIITTQDRPLLRRLGVPPDIVLGDTPPAGNRT